MVVEVPPSAVLEPDIYVVVEPDVRLVADDVEVELLVVVVVC